jgi:hypothetical protein
MTPAALSDELIGSFRADGFVVVPGLLTADELTRFGAEVDRAVTGRKGHDARPVADKSRYEQSFIQCQNLWEDYAGVRPLTFHPRVAGTAARLLGASAVRLWHDQALYKEPGGRNTDPHQDQPYWPIAETDTITAWIPLDGSTVVSGAMAYLPGSHLLGIQPFVDIFSGQEVDVLSRPPLAGIEPRFVEVPPGGVAFHHGLTFHLAGPNSTERTRRVHTAIYFRDGSTRGTAAPHYSVDRAGIAVGQVIDSPVTPVAWPRADGDLPTPPAPPERSFGGIFPGRAPFPESDAP